VSKLDQFYSARCKSSSQKFSIIGFVVKELHLLKVEEVELFFFFPQSKQVVFSFGLTFGQRHKKIKIKKN
jgi:hypothetical protein